MGLNLLIVGMNASDSVVDRWSNVFSGHFTASAISCIVGGVAVALPGPLTFSLTLRKA